MIETRKTEIEGVTYIITLLGAKKARSGQIRLMRMLGPAVARMIGSGADPDKLGDMNVSDLLPALERLIQDATENDLEWLCDTFAEMTTFNENGLVGALGKEFDTHFSGHLMRMYKWLAFCIKENYADFFSAAGDMKRLADTARSAKATSSSESPTA